MQVDEAGDQRAPVEVDELGAPGGRRWVEAADRQDPFAADEDVGATEDLGGPDGGVAEEAEVNR